ncbi:MAG TPA: hypothetical protein VFB38_22480 [Chthonomonadaceae bacterium]|nr:hypothetical protein [Chthonomonadaceae bacterium]
MAQPQVFEGTIEEITEQLRAANFGERSFKVIVVPEEEFSANGQTLQEALASLLEDADKVEFEPPTSELSPVAQAIAEKFRKQDYPEKTASHAKSKQNAAQEPAQARRQLIGMGKFAGILPSSEEFMRRKQEEIELEERKFSRAFWRRRYL